MKILGKTENALLCEITEDEIYHVFNHYSAYSAKKEGKGLNLNIGTEIDLGEGFNFAHQIENLCRSFKDHLVIFQRTQNALQTFAEMVLKNAKN